MTLRVGVLGIDRRRDHGKGFQEQLTILVRRIFEVGNVVLNVAGHQVEGLGQLSDFGPAPYVSALGEVALGDGAGGSGEVVNGTGDGFRGKKTHNQA